MGYLGGAGIVPGSSSLVLVDTEFADNVKLLFGTGSDVEFFFDGTDMFTQLAEVSAATGWMIGLAASPPSPDGVAVHLWRGTAGSIVANASAALIIEDDVTVYLQFLTPNTIAPGILFGDPESAVAGAFTYNHATDIMAFTIDAAARFAFGVASVEFQQATVISSTAGAITHSPATRSVFTKPINLGSPGSLTIASGAVAITGPYHTLVVEGGAGSGADSLATATGGADGDLLILKTTTSGANDQVTISDGTGADTFILAGGADFVMDHLDDRLELLHNGTEWVERSRSSNS